MGLILPQIHYHLFDARGETVDHRRKKCPQGGGLKHTNQQTKRPSARPFSTRSFQDVTSKALETHLMNKNY